MLGTYEHKKRNWGTWVAFRRFSFILTFLSTFFGASQMQINFDVRILFTKLVEFTNDKICVFFFILDSYCQTIDSNYLRLHFVLQSKKSPRADLFLFRMNFKDYEKLLSI